MVQNLIVVMLKVNCIFKGLMVIDYISIFTEKSTLDVRFSVTLDNSWSQVAGRVMTLFYQLFLSILNILQLRSSRFDNSFYLWCQLLTVTRHFPELTPKLVMSVVLPQSECSEYACKRSVKSGSRKLSHPSVEPVCVWIRCVRVSQISADDIMLFKFAQIKQTYTTV